MVDHDVIQKALRAKLLTLRVCSTGATTLSATATGYARTAGSFLSDGFAVGMEVAPSGFTNTLPGTITAVSALAMSVTLLKVAITNGLHTVTHPAMAMDAAAGGRSLTVGLPSLQAWENTELVPEAGCPYVEEQYLPGTSAINNDGYAGVLELRPLYAPRIYVPEHTGITADGRYADAITRLFLPGTSLALPSGDSLVVRGDTGPYRGQRAPSATAGWSCVPVTIPLKVTTVAVPA